MIHKKYEIPDAVIQSDTVKFLEEEHSARDGILDTDRQAILPGKKAYTSAQPTIKPEFLDDIQTGVNVIKDGISAVFEPVLNVIEIINQVLTAVGGYTSLMEVALGKFRDEALKLIEEIGGDASIWLMYKSPISLEGLKEGIDLNPPIIIPDTWDKSEPSTVKEFDKKLAQEGTEFTGNLFNRQTTEDVFSFIKNSFELNGRDPSLVPDIPSHHYIGGISCLFLAPEIDEIMKKINRLLGLFSLPTKQEIDGSAQPDVIDVTARMGIKISHEPPITIRWSSYDYAHKILVKLTPKNLTTNKQDPDDRITYLIDNTGNQKINALRLDPYFDTNEPNVQSESDDDYDNPNEDSSTFKKTRVTKRVAYPVQFSHEYTIDVKLQVTLPVLESLVDELAVAKFFNITNAESVSPEEGSDAKFSTIASDNTKIRVPKREDYVGFAQQVTGTFGDGIWLGGSGMSFLPEIEELKSIATKFINQTFDSLIQGDSLLDNLIEAFRKRVQMIVDTTEEIKGKIFNIIDKVQVDITDIGFIKVVDWGEGGQTRYINEILDLKGIPKFVVDSANYVGGFWILVSGGMDPTLEATFQLIKSFFEKDEEDGLPDTVIRDALSQKEDIENTIASVDKLANQFNKAGIISNPRVGTYT